MPYPHWTPAPFVISNYTTFKRTWNVSQCTSGAMTNANSMIGYPFLVESRCTLYKAWWMNGSSAGSNSEVALYDRNFNQIQTTGSTAGSGSSAPQTVDWTDITIGPGWYNAVFAHSSSTANRISGQSRDFHPCQCWWENSITLGSLPATATPVYTGVNMPVFGFITRSNFDI